ncbi:GST-like protein [Streptococcus gallinaceus]|uniref:glutathione-dependent disulfide-bond oxidoreductase n=1 Tax=Streptococcus gallinaceus TaxID=165758 RepID=UPI0020A0FE8C|nr:glutathione-dependent disulfide-bond oxidoreductase [Streptococcus gallinaceus]MCP1638337.1 GST-like protein [Streptococcus gallinaceus]MCP1769576.1 GST-like protein [Streptococcus gallinaceus]
MDQYVKPAVWRWEDENNAPSGNRPTAGSRFEQTLSKGEHRFQVYSLATPNGIKVPILLEELLELGHQADYDLFKVDIGKGEQFGSEFVVLNPNSKIPVLLDQEIGINVFESANILLYLAEQFSALIPTDLAERTQVLNWLFWQTGVAPFVGGGFGHFFHYAPTAQQYPIDRYTMETKRQLDLLDQQLAQHAYVAGKEYSIADVAIWSWYGRLLDGNLYPGAADFLDGQSYTHVLAWAEKIKNRPAVQRALAKEYQPMEG